MGTHKETNFSRCEFERWVQTLYPLEELKHLAITRQVRDEDKYKLSFSQTSWNAWQASRESLEANRDKNFCWVVYFKDADKDVPLKDVVPCGALLWADVYGQGSTLCWDGEIAAKSEEDVLKFIQPTIDKMKLSVTDVDIWEE